MFTVRNFNCYLKLLLSCKLINQCLTTFIVNFYEKFSYVLNFKNLFKVVFHIYPLTNCFYQSIQRDERIFKPPFTSLWNQLLLEMRSCPKQLAYIRPVDYGPLWGVVVLGNLIKFLLSKFVHQPVCEKLIV